MLADLDVYRSIYRLQKQLKSPCVFGFLTDQLFCYIKTFLIANNSKAGAVFVILFKSISSTCNLVLGTKQNLTTIPSAIFLNQILERYVGFAASRKKLYSRSQLICLILLTNYSGISFSQTNLFNCSTD